MEVLCFFSSDKNLIRHFDGFLGGYSKLVLESRDEDTAYYQNPGKKGSELYFHFIPNDLAYEFSINYIKEEEEHIRNFFSGDEIYSFDIQYRNESFLVELLRDLRYYLEQKGVNAMQQILIGHPHRGVIEFNEVAPA